jgi:hypothetical protein
MKIITFRFILEFLAAIIMLQTLFFKFTAHPDSVFIFSQLGLEPMGRIGIGIGELIASLLIFIPRTTWFGSLMGLGLMSGAIGAHLLKLGIEVNEDHGTLFLMAASVFVCCAILLWMTRREIPYLYREA